MRNHNLFPAFTILLLVAAAAGPSAGADEATRPTGAVVLTVAGDPFPSACAE